MKSKKKKFKLGDLVLYKGLLDYELRALMYKEQVKIVNNHLDKYKPVKDKDIIKHLDKHLKAEIMANFMDEKRQYMEILNNYYNDLRGRYDY